MSNITSVSKERLAKKAQAAEQAKGHINAADAAVTEEVKQKRLNVNIPEELHKKLKQAALDRDTSVKEIVIQGIKEMIK